MAWTDLLGQDGRALRWVTLRSAHLIDRKPMASLQDVAVDPLLRERPSPTLRANFKWTLAGNLIYSICQWGMLTVLAKAGNASIVGRFAFALAISAPVFMLTWSTANVPSS